MLFMKGFQPFQMFGLHLSARLELYGDLGIPQNGIYLITRISVPVGKRFFGVVVSQISNYLLYHQVLKSMTKIIAPGL